MGKNVLHDAILAVGLFLGGIAVNSMVKIADETEKIRIDLAVIASKVVDHEKRIERLEKPQ